MFGMFKKPQESIKDKVEPDTYYDGRKFYRYNLGQPRESCHYVQVIEDPSAPSWQPQYLVVSTASSEPIAKGFTSDVYAQLWVDNHLSEIVEVIEADTRVYEKTIVNPSSHRLRPHGYVNDKGEWFPLPGA